MKSICIYCGSNPGADPAHQKIAQELGIYLSEKNIDLIYGGSDSGLMGIVANSALDNNGKVTAIMPRDLKRRIGHNNNSRLIIVKDMHERKKTMFDMADAFIALPGGFGTLDEIFEILTWGKLGYHNKPCGFLNVNGYYDHLLDFLNVASGEGFINAADRSMAFAADNIDDLIEHFQMVEGYQRMRF